MYLELHGGSSSRGTYELADGTASTCAARSPGPSSSRTSPTSTASATLATNGIDKPVLNVFRMLGMMSGDRVTVESTGALALRQTIRDGGVRDAPDVDGLATARSATIAVLVWNYHDDERAAAPARGARGVDGLPARRAVLVQHYRIDDDHSNAYTAWKQMGSPQPPTPAQYARLEAADNCHCWGRPSGGNRRTAN